MNEPCFLLFVSNTNVYTACIARLSLIWFWFSGLFPHQTIATRFGLHFAQIICFPLSDIILFFFYVRTFFMLRTRKLWQMLRLCFSLLEFDIFEYGFLYKNRFQEFFHQWQFLGLMSNFSYPLFSFHVSSVLLW